MKKIIALILATIMVMLAVAACGSTQPAETTKTPNTPDNGGTTSTSQTTQATTTTEQIVIPDPYTALAFLPAGKDVAVNVITGEEIGKLTAGTGIELKGGYFYVVDVVPAEGKQTATKEVGAAVADKQVALGWTNVKSDGKVLSYTSYFHREKAASGKSSNGTTISTLNYNFCYMGLADLNAALEGTGLGEFGTITIKAVDGDVSTFAFGTDPEGEELLTDYKWNFVYVGYNGESYGKATGTTYTPIAMNAKDIIYSACDKALGNEIGTLRGLNVTAMDNYKAPESVVAANGKYNGTSIQETHVGNFKNAFVPVKYAAALKNYKALIAEGATTVDEAGIAAALTEANAALEAAQKALDDAVKANAAVKALKDAMDAAAAALEDAKQAAYEAKAAHETEKAKSSSSPETAAALAVRTEKEAVQTTAQATYDAAKKAYDEAVAADATLAPLATALTDATAAQKTAASNQTKVDTYKEWAPIYAKFCAAYDELANVALWNTEDMDNSPIAKMFKDVETPAYPTFTYYYDEATDTYTVFVTSMTASNMVEFFYNNDAIK
ncbi:MAG: hypothetical protein IJX55_06145 [Clostridia bacterium]|nr:hypothetical protein [Clostridia bacterium]